MIIMIITIMIVIKTTYDAYMHNYYFVIYSVYIEKLHLDGNCQYNNLRYIVLGVYSLKSKTSYRQIHYNDVMVGTIASQITRLTIV